MPASRWSVFQGMLNNRAESKQSGGKWVFALSYPVPSKCHFFLAVCRVVGLGCSGGL